MVLGPAMAVAQEKEPCDMESDTKTFTSTFSTLACQFKNGYFAYEQGNPYFIMEPGWQMILEG